MDDLLTTGEAARLLGKAPRTVRGYIERGLLPVARRVTPRLVLVRREDVARIGADPPRPGVRTERGHTDRADPAPDEAHPSSPASAPRPRD